MAEKEEKKDGNAQESPDAEKGSKAEKAGEKLIAAACEAYGIAPKYVFASSVKDGVATVLTCGGSRVRFKAGDKVAPLDQIAVTGVNPNAKRKPITGPAKK